MTPKTWATAALLALAASAAQASPDCNKSAIRAGDSFGGHDKRLHLVGSAFAGLMAKDIFKLDNETQAFGVAMLPGIAKELMDASDTCNVFSTKDLVADAIGAYIGVRLHGWMVTPRSISYQMSF